MLFGVDYCFGVNICLILRNMHILDTKTCLSDKNIVLFVLLSSTIPNWNLLSRVFVKSCHVLYLNYIVQYIGLVTTDGFTQGLPW
jgi:hypothetical protein